MENIYYSLPNFRSSNIEKIYHKEQIHLRIKGFHQFVCIISPIYIIRGIIYFSNYLEDNHLNRLCISLILLFLGSGSFLLDHFLHKYEEKASDICKNAIVYSYCLFILIIHIFIFERTSNAYAQGFSFMIVMMNMLFIATMILRNTRQTLGMFGICLVGYFWIHTHESMEQAKECLVKMICCYILCILIVHYTASEHRMRYITFYQKESQNSMYLRFLEFFGEPILFINSTMKITFHNVAAINCFGDCTHNINLSKLLQLKDESTNLSLQQIIQQAFQININDYLAVALFPKSSTVQVSTSSGVKTFSVSLVGGIGVSEINTSIGILFKDISAEVEVKERRIKKKYENLILTSFSHEIRNGLNGIMGIFSLLQFDLPTVLQNLVERGISSTQSLCYIMNDIADYIYIQNNYFKLNCKTFSLSSVFSHLTQIIKINLSSPKVQVLSKIHENTPDQIYADQDRITQILSNLLNNAVKYTQIGHISICAKKIDDTIKFSIKDSGIGIPSSEINQLFQIEENIDSGNPLSSSRLARFGLTISQLIASQMNSHISVFSIEGIGTEFSFSISYNENEDFEAVQFYSSLLIPEERCQASFCEKNKLEMAREVYSRLETPKPCLLIVDDEDSNRFVANELFKKKVEDQICILQAPNGKKALSMIAKKILGKFSPLLLLIDLEMPKMGGIETIDLICQRFRPTRRIFIVVCSAFHSNWEKEKCIKVGADLYFEKPLTLPKVKRIWKMFQSKYKYK